MNFGIGGEAWKSGIPLDFMNALIECSSWIKEMMRICALHLGHSRVVDDLVQETLRGASPVVLELLLCLLPGVAPSACRLFRGSEARSCVGMVEVLRMGIQVMVQGGLCACGHLGCMCVSELRMY